MKYAHEESGKRTKNGEQNIVQKTKTWRIVVRSDCESSNASESERGRGGKLPFGIKFLFQGLLMGDPVVVFSPAWLVAI